MIKPLLHFRKLRLRSRSSFLMGIQICLISRNPDSLRQVGLRINIFQMTIFVCFRPRHGLWRGDWYGEQSPRLSCSGTYLILFNGKISLLCSSTYSCQSFGSLKFGYDPDPYIFPLFFSGFQEAWKPIFFLLTKGTFSSLFKDNKLSRSYGTRLQK
jgi:hypothetical protein